MDTKTMIENVCEHVDRLRDLQNKYADILRVDLPLWDIVFEATDRWASLISDVIEDDSKFLDWYIWENDCGRNGFEAGIGDDMRPIRNVDDLLWLITGEGQ